MAKDYDKVSKTREYSNRAGVGEKGYVPGADNDWGGQKGKDFPRNFDTRGLRSATPFPNIIRIEQLAGPARNRYSSGFNNLIDGLHSVAEAGRIGGIRDEVFYGFVKTPPDSQKIRIGWQNRGGVGEVLSTLGGMAGGVTGAITSPDPKGLGAKIVETANAGASGASALIKGTGDLMAQLGGINAGIVGQNTIKRVRDVSMESFSVTCSWYLPEQYALFCKGIRSLFRIAYPNEVNLGNALTADLKAKFSYGLTDINGVNTNSSGPEKNDVVQSESSGSMLGDAWNALVDAGGDLISGLANSAQWVATKFGATFSVDPSPVRVTIGQSWDLEPLVITNLTIKPSKETFIEPTTHAHLPITVEATISLDYWITPRAGQENMSIAGQEIFGWLQEDRYKNVIKDTEKYVAEKNEKMWGLLTQDKLNSAPTANRRRGVNM